MLHKVLLLILSISVVALTIPTEETSTLSTNAPSASFGAPSYTAEPNTEAGQPGTGPHEHGNVQQSCGRGCCGFPGMPGIPGTPGHNGVPGTPGPKGDVGMKGDSGNGGKQGLEGRRGNKGPKGDLGPPGPPGVKGQSGDFLSLKGDPGNPGLPGPIGMKGFRGPRGPSGIQGPAGQELPDELRIAFTVTNATRFPSANTPLVFRTVLSNSGNGYSIDTGKFTCTAAGLYAFTFQFFGGYHHYRPETASLIKNSEVALTAMSTVDSRLGNFAVLDLTEGDDVWLEITESRDFGPSNYNSFTGFRLF